MKGSFDERDGASMEAKVKRLKKCIQELDSLIIDAKYFASEIQSEDLTKVSRGSKESPKTYKRPYKAEDWGQEIDKGTFVYFVLSPQVNAVKIGYQG